MKRFLFILKRIAQITAVVGIVVLFIVTLGAAVKSSNARVCSAVQIHLDFIPEYQLIEQSEILSIAQNVIDTPIVGKSLLSLDLKALEKTIKKAPYIENAEAYIDQKQVLHVSVVQKRPFLRIINNDGVSYYLASDQTMMPLHDNFTVSVPLATGYVKTLNSNRDDSIVQNQLWSLVTEINADTLWSALIDHVEVLENGTFKLIPKFNHHEVYFGQYDATASKRLLNLKVFYRQVLNLQGWDKYKAINIELDNQVIATKRDSI